MNKKLSFSILVVLLLIFSMGTLSFAAQKSGKLKPNNQIIGNNYPGTNVQMEPGDVLVTDDTSAGGLTGHSGIVIDVDGDISTILGYGQKPIIQTWDQWYNGYTDSDGTVHGSHKDNKVMRYSNANVAQNAANWAASYPTNYSNAQYYLGTDEALGDPNFTYCSKIPWLAFYYGGNVAVDGYSPFNYILFPPYHWVNATSFSEVADTGTYFSVVSE